MSTLQVDVPDIGDFADVAVIEIHVAVGDTVKAEDPLVTLESDKATVDVPSPASGTVNAVLVKVGDHAKQGTPIVKLEPDTTPAESSQIKANADLSDTHPAKADLPHSSATARSATPSAAGADAEVVVIGSGPGGYTAAFRAADLGLKTILVEKQPTLGGVCLNVGCIPSKALLHAARVISEAQEMAQHGVSFGPPQIDLPKLITWKQGVVDKLTGGLARMAKQRKVEVITGMAEITAPHTVRVGDRDISFNNCIIATGSEPVRLPFIPADPRVVDSTGALAPEEIPHRFLVIGGGIIGLEMATVYSALGAEVTVVEMMDQLIPGADPDLVGPLHKRMQGKLAAIYLGIQVTAVAATKTGLRVSFSQTADQTFDQILVAVGRVPSGRTVGAQTAGVHLDEHGFIPVDAQQRTNVPHIFAIGDVTGGPMLAHKATHEAKTAAEVIAGVAGARFDALTVPSVAYTDPEVAWMGLTETYAKANGVKYEKASFPWAASGRALGLSRPEGFTKLLFEPTTDRLLGAGIVGVGAGDLIAETVLALEAGLTASDLALTIHPHPTLSETIAFSAELQDGTITDLLPRRERRHSAHA
ncbi:MAG: dihydrolipoyl dehydrogenase [Solirubrobacteraceae bacterium]